MGDKGHDLWAGRCCGATESSSGKAGGTARLRTAVQAGSPRSGPVLPLGTHRLPFEVWVLGALGDGSRRKEVHA